ncbi:uncharacterized protein laf [Drosophila tropicalis]|uniref:uncharacterized protein laf n=1 Tax=Drosophila tropicalis TaxID=46794 RepID=UPI0035ABD242
MSSYTTKSSKKESHLQKLARLEGLQVSSKSENSIESTESDNQADCEDYEEEVQDDPSIDSKLMQLCWQRADDLVSKFLSSRNEESSKSSKRKLAPRVSSGSSKNSQSTDASKTYSEIYSEIYEESKARQEKAESVCKFYNLHKEDRTERWVKQMGQPDRNYDELFEVASSGTTSYSSSLLTVNKSELGCVEEDIEEDVIKTKSELTEEEEQEMISNYKPSVPNSERDIASEPIIKEEMETAAKDSDLQSDIELESLVEEEMEVISKNQETASKNSDLQSDIELESLVEEKMDSDFEEEIDENALTENEMDIIWKYKQEASDSGSDFEDELDRGALIEEEVEIIAQYKSMRSPKGSKKSHFKMDFGRLEEAVIEEELEIMSQYKTNPISSRSSHYQMNESLKFSSSVSSNISSNYARSNYHSDSISYWKTTKTYQDRANSPICIHRETKNKCDQTDSLRKSTENVGIQYPSDNELYNQTIITNNPLGLRIHNADEALIGVTPDYFDESMIILDDDADFLNLSLTDDESQIHCKLMAAALTNKKSSTSITGKSIDLNESISSSSIMASYTPSVYFHRRSDSDLAKEEEKGNSSPEKDYVAYLAEVSLRACSKGSYSEEVRVRPRLKREATKKAEELYTSEMQLPVDRHSLAKDFNLKLERQLKILNESFQ